MNEQELAAKYGGVPVANTQTADAELAAKFGGVKVSPEDDLAAKFGGVRAPAAPKPAEAAPQPEVPQITVVGQPGAGEEAPPPAQPVPEEKPGFFDQITRILERPQDVKMPETPVHERNWLAQQVAIAGSGLNIGTKNLESSILANRIAGITEVQESRISKYGSVDNMPEDTRKSFVENQKKVESLLDEMGTLNKEIDKIKQESGRTSTLNFEAIQRTPAYKQGDFWTKAGMVGEAFIEDPIGISTDLGMQSLPASIAMAVPAVLARFGGASPTVSAGVGGASSMMTEFGNQYLDLRAQGMSHGEAWEKAGVKSAVIGLFDAASFYSAGKAASEVVKNLENGAKHGLLAGAKEVGKEVGKQALYGGAGEAGGSFAINQQIDPGQVLAEMAGEVFGAPGEAVATYQSQAQIQQLKDMLALQGQPSAEELAKSKGFLQGRPKLEGDELLASTVERFKALGFNDELATRLAQEAIAEDQGVAKRTEPGTSEPSVPVSAPAGAAVPTAETTEAGGLGGVSAPTGVPAGREGTEQRALTGKLEADVTAPAVYAILNPDPLKAEDKAIPAADAKFILETLVDRAAQGKLTPEVFAQSEIGQRLDTSTLMAVNDAIRANPVEAMQSLLARVDQQATAETPTETAEAEETPAAATTDVDTKYWQGQIRKQLKMASTLRAKAAQTGEQRWINQAVGNERKAHALAETYGWPSDVTAPAAPPPVPPATKGKVGRPALPPEQRKAAAPIDKVSKKEKDDAAYRLKPPTEKDPHSGKDLQLFEEIMAGYNVQRTDFPEGPEGDAIYREAHNLVQQEHNEALLRLHRFSRPGIARSSKYGEKAKQMWDQLPANIRELVERQAAELKDTLRSEAPAVMPTLTRSTSGKNNPQYATFTNATQALNHIKRTGNPFEKELAKRITPFLKDTRLVVVGSVEEVPESVRDKFRGAHGMYTNVGGKPTIYLLEGGGTNNTVFLHEAVHRATVDRINQYIIARDHGGYVPRELAFAVEQLNILMVRAENAYFALLADRENMDANGQRIIDNMEAFNSVEAFTNVKEFVAYGFTHPYFQEFLTMVPGRIEGAVVTKENGFTRFLDAIRRIIGMGDHHKSAFQDLLIITDKAVIGKAYATGPMVKLEDAEPAKVGGPKTPEQAAADNAKEVGKARKISKNVLKTLEKVQQSFLAGNVSEAAKELGSMIAEGHDFNKYKAFFDVLLAQVEASKDAKASQALRALLYSMQTADIMRWKGDEIAGLPEIDEATQQMAAMEEHLKVSAIPLTKEFGAFTRKYGQKVLANAMHLARLNKVSPRAGTTVQQAIAADPIIKYYDDRISKETNPNKARGLKKPRKEREDAIRVVYAAWDALGKQRGGQEIYEKVRQAYKDYYLAGRKILNDQIEVLPIDDASKAKLLKSVRLMYEEAKSEEFTEYLDENGEPLRAPRAPEDYFPFRRYGDHLLLVKGPNGRERYHFESEEDRNLFLALRAKQLGADKNDGNIFDISHNGYDALRKNYQDSSIMLQQMFKNIDEITSTGPSTVVDPNATLEEAKTAMDQRVGVMKEELKDQLYQVYLMTLPERSFRKQFLHAEGIAGFSHDVFRNYKSSVNMYARQLAKMEYAPQIEAQIIRARDSFEGMDTQLKHRNMIFLNEIAIRAREEVNKPPTPVWVTRANQLAYGFLLTSGASAITQFLEVPIIVASTLNGKYGAGSLKTLAKYNAFWNLANGVAERSSVTGEVIWNAPSIGNFPAVKNNPVLRRAFEAALDRHMTTVTNTSILTNVQRTPEGVLGSYAPKEVMKYGIAATWRTMTALFNGAERLSREITFMASFESEYKKNGGNFDAAVDAAVEFTYDTLGRYDSFNRARILRNAPGKILGQFKQYVWNRLSFFVRNFFTATRLFRYTPEERSAARTTLIGTLGMGFLFHGMRGMLGISLFCFWLDIFLDKFGDEEEKRKRRAQSPLTADNSYMRFFYEFLPKYFGEIKLPGFDGREHRLSDVIANGPISALTDINFGARTSWDGMIWRGVKWQPTVSETLKAYATENLGPAASVGGGFVKGLELAYKGDYKRAAELMLPTFYTAPLKGVRLAEEGAKTIGRKTLLTKDEISTTNAIAQGVGFAPTRLSILQDKAFRMNEELFRAKETRKQLLQALGDAYFSKIGKVKDVIKRMAEYNERYPMDNFEITMDTIDDSLDARAEKIGKNFRGIEVDEELYPYVSKYLKYTKPLK